MVDKLDRAFSYVAGLEAVAVDPQQGMLLEVACEVIKNAGVRLEDMNG